MQINFSQYFKFFSAWHAPIYIISGDGDGRLDIETRLLKTSKDSEQLIKRLYCKKKDELAQIKDHFRSQDLFNDTPLLIVTITSAILYADLINILDGIYFQKNDKLIIWGPKLTPKLKNNDFWSKSTVVHYALWPYSPEQVSMWWQNHCQELKIKPTRAVTQSIMLQTGYRIDELIQITQVWQLQYPSGGEIDEAPPVGEHQLSDRVYDEAYDWLRGGNIKSGFDIEHNMPFYFALKQSIAEIVQYHFLINIGVPSNSIMKQLGWWPQKFKTIEMLSRTQKQDSWMQMIWTLSDIEMARLGSSAHSFNQLMNCFYHRQSLPLHSINVR